MAHCGTSDIKHYCSLTGFDVYKQNSWKKKRENQLFYFLDNTSQDQAAKLLNRSPVQEVNEMNH